MGNNVTDTFVCKLASFDLDGTLVLGTSTGGFLATKMGHAEEMLKAEALYGQGLVANDYVSTLDGQFYKGYSKQDIFELLEDIPVIAHIGETVKAFNEKGIPCVICTLAWEFVAEFIAERYGFVAWSGPSLEYDSENKFTGKINKHFDEFGKPVFIQSHCDSLGINMSNVFHIGDSRSDIELFKQAGFSIAINATDDAKQAATTTLEASSILDALKLIPGI